jgi:formylglycine-generating enzyme required for sulfatase activity
MERKISSRQVTTAVVAGIFAYCICSLGFGLTVSSWLRQHNFRVSNSPAQLIDIPAGDYMMGSADGEKVSFQNEKPQHRVYLNEYWIDVHKVSNAMYAACVDDEICTAPGSDYSGWRSNIYENPDYRDHPVTNVTWQQARDYCIWAGRDLPTEAQWEKAARGLDRRIYPWGDTIDCSLANYSECKIKDTTPVNRYKAGASPYGVLDMSGNVWEWVLDWYDPGYYGISPSINPGGPITGTLKVLRGGSWLNGATYVRTAYRFPAKPDQPSNYYGFRCANHTKSDNP